MVPVPDPIPGSIGSRIRVVLGDYGFQYLLLLNHGTGEREWQEKCWYDIPSQLTRQINNCTAKDRVVKSVDFDCDGDWFVHGQKLDGSGSHSWWERTSAASEAIRGAVCSNPSVKVSFGSNRLGQKTYVMIGGLFNHTLSDEVHNDDLWERIEMLQDEAASINFVRLFHNGQYFISDELGTKWELFNEDLKAELRDNSKGKIEDVAVSKNGDWIVIRHNSFASINDFPGSYNSEIDLQGIDEELLEKLNQFYTDQRLRVVSRNREIREANTANEAHSVAFNAAREAVQREERELFLRQTRDRELSDQETAAAVAAADIAQVNAATRISSLEATLEKRLIEEANDIKETEEKLRQTKEKLLNRKRSFREAMQAMPPGTQSRIKIDDSNSNDDSNNTCVVCRDRPSLMAVVPCGHMCLCNTCSDVCMNGDNDQPTCPLCRGDMQSVLRIYLGN